MASQQVAGAQAKGVYAFMKHYIGMEWGGSHSGLLNTVLRGEWGFRGMVLTIMKYLKRRKLAAAASAPADAPVKA